MKLAELDGLRGSRQCGDFYTAPVCIPQSQHIRNNFVKHAHSNNISSCHSYRDQVPEPLSGLCQRHSPRLPSLRPPLVLAKGPTIKVIHD